MKSHLIRLEEVGDGNEKDTSDPATVECGVTSGGMRDSAKPPSTGNDEPYGGLGGMGANSSTHRKRTFNQEKETSPAFPSPILETASSSGSQSKKPKIAGHEKGMK